MIEVPVDPTTGIHVGICVVLGPGDGGKTTIAAAVARAWVPPGQEERLIVVGEVQKLAELLKVPNHPVDSGDRDVQDTFFRAINEMEGAALIVVDEADMYYSPGGRTYGSHEFRKLVNIGRNFGKSLILIARGSSDLAKNTINQARIILMCRTAEPNLLDYAERFMPEIPDVREVIMNLETHEFLLWCPKMTPRWQGWMKVVNGSLMIVPPPESTSLPGEESTPSTPSDTATTPGEPASTPGAGSSSRTGSGPTSATTTIPNGSKSDGA
jgi:hypothetical protein